jgi:DNA gyrase/topoisomerase IV subunit A
MRPAPDDRVVGALALPEPSTFLVVTPEGGERKLGLADVPVGRRGGKGQKVVKRGGVAAIRRPEG